MDEYFDQNPPVSLEEAFDSTLAVEYAALSALATEKGIQPPRNSFLVDQDSITSGRTTGLCSSTSFSRLYDDKVRFQSFGFLFILSRLYLIIGVMIVL